MAWRFTKAAPAPSPREYFIRKAKKTKAGKDALTKLNDYLNANTAAPMYWLHDLWSNQQNAITYKELREAIINGYMDEKTLQAWQQDYANFVAVHLAPAWLQAAQAGAAAVQAAATGGWVFDAMADGVNSWVTKHGAEWITAISDDSREAIRALIGAGTTGQYTVDELSRAIRPLIGLTKPQSEANLKYYTQVRDNLLANNPKMKPADAEAKAKEAAMKYAARQHRYRAYTIATTETAFAYNFGYSEYVLQAQAAGYMGDGYLMVDTAADDDVCPICAAMEGKQIPIDQPAAAPLFAGQTMIPPFHPRCRCATHFEETTPPVFQPAQQPAQTAQGGLQPWPGQTTQAGAQSAQQGGAGTSQATIPQGISTPPGMTYNKTLSIGNTGHMESWTDANGQEWYFKPAQSKSGTPEQFRAYVQEAGYKVQGIVDPDTAVEVGVGDLNGTFGAFQKKVDTTKGIDLEAWQKGAATDLGTDVTAQIQREHVTDWLLGNFDAHGENFVTDASGRIIGLDKEQSFRYIKDAASGKMSYTYHPNHVYGETEPLYNTVYRRFAHGEIDLDLQDTLTYIKRVESIPDAEYREIFREYAESLHGKGKAAEDLLDAIVERKSTLRETYRTFYSELLTERTGQAVKFVWADEAAAVAQQPLAAVQQTAASIQGMSIADLKAIAKNKGIAYYNNMNKTQLVTAITDPTQAAAMSNQVKTRLAANAAARKATQTPPPAKMPKGVEAAGDIFKDLSRVPTSKNGVPVASDKGSVEGLGLTARRMNIGGTEYYEVSGKLTEETWSKTWTVIKPNSTVVPFQFEEADPALAMFSNTPVTLNHVNLKARQVVDGQNTFELYVHNGSAEYRSWQGFFRVRVPVSPDGTMDAAEMSRVLKSVGLDDLLATPTPEAEKTLIKSRLIWQNAPGRVSELQGLTGQALEDKLDDIIRDLGISDARINGVELRKICEGYATYYDPAQAAAMKKAGADYVWSGVRSPDAVVGVVKSGGMSATNRRTFSGMRMTGSSPSDDMISGGADSVFTRLGVSGKGNRFNNSYCGGPFRIIIDEKELGRTDWYAYDFDNYGRTDASNMTARLPAVDFAKKMTQSYKSSNEIMFRQGIPTSSFTEIVCESTGDRADLIAKFKAEGITEINGVPLSKFIKVGSTQ